MRAKQEQLAAAVEVPNEKLCLDFEEARQKLPPPKPVIPRFTTPKPGNSASHVNNAQPLPTSWQPVVENQVPNHVGRHQYQPPPEPLPTSWQSENDHHSEPADGETLGSQDTISNITDISDYETASDQENDLGDDFQEDDDPSQHFEPPKKSLFSSQDHPSPAPNNSYVPYDDDVPDDDDDPSLHITPPKKNLFRNRSVITSEPDEVEAATVSPVRKLSKKLKKVTI